VSIDGNPPRLWDVPLNGEGSGDLTLVNRGSAPLVISSVTSSNPHFTTRLQAAEIAPRERRPLTVTYHPVTWGPETTRLTIFHNDPSQGPVTVFVEGRAYEPPPVLQVSPTVLDFGDLHRGDSATLAFDIRNAGAGPLFLYGDNLLLYSSCRAQTDLVLPLTLLPNESRTAHVTYTADLSKVLCYSFSFYSNDPSNHSVTISMPATILTPRIALDYNFLEFPYTAVGRTSTAAMRVRNVGSDTLVISSASIVYDYDPVFALATFLPLSIPAGGFADLQLLYSPLSDRNSGGMVTLESNDPYLPTVSFQILGFGYLPESIPLHTREPFR
jgi:hypothetical protein